jgi:hypothetical protein
VSRSRRHILNQSVVQHQAAATWAVVWNNPRLHAPDREKVWVACGKHKRPLADYLAVRSFLKRVEPLGAVH